LPVDEREQIERAARGDKAAFEQLYAAHGKRATAYFLRSGFAPATADDLTQETFIRVYKFLSTYDPLRGSFAGWLSTIARNIARKHWSRRTGGEHFDPLLADEVFSAPVNPSSSPEALEEVSAVRGCVDKLPDELGRLVRLRYVDGRTTRGIAAVVAMPESTVRVRLSQALLQLQECLRTKGFLK